MSRLDGKVCLITGAARGIGARTAEVFAEHGAFVYLTDLDEGAGEEKAKALRDAGGQARFLKHNVVSEDDWIQVLGVVRDEHQRLDVLVNNAGIELIKPLANLTLDDWHKVSSVNLDGVFLGTKHAVPLMQRKEGMASVINLSSVAGIIGAPFQSAYCMTKGGVRLFTKAAAMEFAALGLNIRVNSMHPGVINTSMGNELLDTFAKLQGKTREEVEAWFAGQQPLGPLGDPDAIANGLLFLASDESAFMTGAELVIDGGLTAQ